MTEREREGGERERQTDRRIDKETERDRERHTQRERGRQKDRQTDRDRERETTTLFAVNNHIQLCVLSVSKGWLHKDQQKKKGKISLFEITVRPGTIPEFVRRFPEHQREG